MVNFYFMILDLFEEYSSNITGYYFGQMFLLLSLSFPYLSYCFPFPFRVRNNWNHLFLSIFQIPPTFVTTPGEALLNKLFTVSNIFLYNKVFQLSLHWALKEYIPRRRKSRKNNLHMSADRMCRGKGSFLTLKFRRNRG